jgi:hypothetical protein
MMSVTIKGHDPEKRYRIEYRYGSVRKRLIIPAGASMPIQHSKENLPIGKVLAVVSCEDAIAPQMVALDIDSGNYKFTGDIIDFKNQIPPEVTGG